MRRRSISVVEELKRCELNEEEEENYPCICITGCTGFLGSWIVKFALEAGFKVHGTTRKIEKAKYLRELDGAAERLVLFECDGLEPKSFHKAVLGCESVIHTAAPFFHVKDQTKGWQELVIPTVEITKNILNACDDCNVKKVVYTSSTAAVCVGYESTKPDHVFSAMDWSDVELLERHGNYIALAKVEAERTAWALSKKCNKYELTVMNPCLILGPMLPGQPHLNTSNYALLRYLDGKVQSIHQQCMHVVDVRDVAKAHIKAVLFEEEWLGWGDRFILVGACPMIQYVVDTLKKSSIVPQEMKDKLPKKVSKKIPKPVMGAIPPNQTQFETPCFDDPEIGGLGMGEFIPLRKTLDDGVKMLLDNDFPSISCYSIENL